jgi:hypothetical protein
MTPLDKVVNKKPFFNFLIFLIFLVCFLGITELAMRVFFKDALGLRLDEMTVLYRYDEKLGWFPIENSSRIVKANKLFQVEHNSRGFRDSEHLVGSNPRIVFLGDSFVWGYDVEKHERFTEKLREKFPNLSIYNLGISGYGTDQQYLLLQQQYDFYKPNIVFLVFCTDNDKNENSHNYVHRGYFKPYFVANGDNLTLQGVPVPKSWRYFIKQHDVLSYSCWFRLITKLYFKYFGPPSLDLNDPTYAILSDMNNFIKSRGATFIVGSQGVDLNLKKFLADNNIPFVDLLTSYTYSKYGNHWTPEGHTAVSDKIHDYLMKERCLEKLATK